MKHVIQAGMLAAAMLGGVTGVLMGTMQSTTVLAGESACLTKSRLWSWKPIDENTLEMTDRQYRRYIVHMEFPCPNLTQPPATLITNFWDYLSCLDSRVFVRVSSPGRAALTCRVASVELVENAKQSGSP